MVHIKMKIRRYTCKAAFILSFTAMIFAAESVSATTGCERDVETAEETNSQPELGNLIDALTSDTTGQSARRKALEKATASAPRSRMEMQLQDRARLVLAGMDIREQKYAAGRERLMPVSTESPVASQAGLLIAESWRQQGRIEESVQWLLRIGRHFPDDLNALQGLLHAAQSLEEGAHLPQAVTLYNEVTQKAMETVALFDALPRAPDARINAVVFAREHLSAGLRRRITTAMLREAPAFGEARQVHREVSREWQCLLLQQQQLEAKRESIQQYTSRLSRASVLASESLVALDQEIASLQAQLVSEDFSATQLAVRKRLVQARNERLHLQAQQDFIARTRDMLPESMAATEARLKVMTQSFAEIHGRTSQELSRVVDAALAEVSGAFRDAAGEGQQRLAEIKVQQAQSR